MTHLKLLRSSYGITNWSGKYDYAEFKPKIIVQHLEHPEDRSYKPGSIEHRTLKHEPFSEATLALRYATTVRKRLEHYRSLAHTEKSICICGHPWSSHNDFPDGLGCSEFDVCVRFIWVWSEEAHQRALAGLGCVTMSELAMLRDEEFRRKEEEDLNYGNDR